MGVASLAEGWRRSALNDHCQRGTDVGRGTALQGQGKRICGRARAVDGCNAGVDPRRRKTIAANIARRNMPCCRHRTPLEIAIGLSPNRWLTNCPLRAWFVSLASVALALHQALGSPINSRIVSQFSPSITSSQFVQNLSLRAVTRLLWQLERPASIQMEIQADNRRPCSSANERRTVPLTDGAREARAHVQKYTTMGVGQFVFQRATVLTANARPVRRPYCRRCCPPKVCNMLMSR